MSTYLLVTERIRCNVKEMVQILKVREQSLPQRQMSPFRKREASDMLFLIIEKHCQFGSFWGRCLNDKQSC